MVSNPESLPPDGLDWASYIRLIGRANAELARYNGILQGIVNPLVLLSPLTMQEAVLSSKIEGTRTSLEEVLEYEASAEARVPEVLGYYRAAPPGRNCCKVQGTPMRILGALAESGLLTTLRPPRGRRAAVLAFSELIAITEGRPVV